MLKLQPPIKFGIKMATYHRDDGRTVELFKNTIKSLLNQTYENWILYLVGDDYEPQEEFESLAKMVPSDKIKFRNVNIHPERKRFPKELARFCGGTNATNYTLDWMKSDNITHLAILDHDDIWKPHHLKTLEFGYRYFPDAYFVYTKGTHSTFGTLPLDNCENKYNNLPPKPGSTLHSSVSWRLDKIPLRYVNTVEENRMTPNGSLFYGDAFMWKIFAEHFAEKGYKFLFISENTLYHNGT